MNGYAFMLTGAQLAALPSGALYWGDAGLLAVSDLHLGKAERIARRGGALLPPYETRETLARLEADITVTGARTVLCLGDSFDDLDAAAGLPEDEAQWLMRLMAGRRWLWIEGNHDPGPIAFGGSHLAEYAAGPLIFRHIARPGAVGEVSGHYHPKARISLGGRALSRPCFLHDAARLILPAYGAYTGGLCWDDPAFAPLFGTEARAIMLGNPPRPLPKPPCRAAAHEVTHA
ncbi:ligase-associated DNA damage response endonuclease PdeM [Rhodovulum iodosum]|nr:ligase-associated DNA damage response endonuclease PdeM [Rhodovulum robiginosum]RSK36775.1 ligase-associated DNA damage response endonuclease PdeM [Rhodovulum robiginosum]